MARCGPGAGEAALFGNGWRPIGSLRRFAREERGNAAVVFALVLLPLLASTGLALDSLLAFTVQERLQRSVDAAGLAAGSTPDPINIVADARAYFRANFDAAPGLATAADPTVQVSTDATEITVTASATMPTRFMRLFGQDSVTVNARSVIERENREMELALVLDNTGSMKDNGKFAAMRNAALELVNTIYRDQDQHSNLLVAVVPYVATVNIGNQHASWLEPTDRVFKVHDPSDPTDDPFYPSPQGWKGCVMARPSPYDETDDPPSVKRFNSYYWADSSDNEFDPLRNPAAKELGNILSNSEELYGPNLSCGTPISPLMQNRQDVRAALNAMQWWNLGGTAGNLGLAWGWRTLSPSWRGLWGGLTPNNRPLDYNRPGAQKVVVMLTDGANQPNTRSGQPGGSDFTAYGRLHDSTYAGPNGSHSAGINFLNQKQARICTTMKQRGIVIYTITFGPSVTAATRDLYSACASSTANYFHAPSNTAVRTAFQTIAVQLNNLRVKR